MTLLYREGGWHSDWKQTCLQHHLLRNLSSSTDNDDDDRLLRGEGSRQFLERQRRRSLVRRECLHRVETGPPRRRCVPGEAPDQRADVAIRRRRGPGLRGPIDATGPCRLLGLAVHDANEAARDDNGTRFTDIAGRYEEGTSGLGYIRWKGTDAVQHKCADCGRDQNWGDDGNITISCTMRGVTTARMRRRYSSPPRRAIERYGTREIDRG